MKRMTRGELGHFTLPSMLGGLAVDEFDARYRDRRPLLVRGAVPEAVARRLVSPSGIDDVLATRDPKAPDLEYVPGATPLPPPRDASEMLDMSGLAGGVAEGAALRIRNAGLHLPDVAQVCAHLADSLGQNVQGDVYLTPASAYAHPPHYDRHDVWVVQTWGRKVWRLYEGNERHVESPAFDAYVDPVEGATMGAETILVLEVGDVLYVPRGVTHHAHCEDEGSIHVTFGCTGLTMHDVLSTYIEERRDADVEMRRTVDPDLLRAALEDDEILQDLVDRLNAPLQRDTLAGVADMLTAQFVRRIPPDHRGMVARAIETPGVEAEAYEYEGSVVWRAVKPSGSDEHRIYFPHDTFEVPAHYVEILTNLKAAGRGSVGDLRGRHPGVDVAEVLSDLSATGIIRPVGRLGEPAA